MNTIAYASGAGTCTFRAFPSVVPGSECSHSTDRSHALDSSTESSAIFDVHLVHSQSPHCHYRWDCADGMKPLCS